jgi:hypothetical protein
MERTNAARAEPKAPIGSVDLARQRYFVNPIKPKSSLAA